MPKEQGHHQHQALKHRHKHYHVTHYLHQGENWGHLLSTHTHDHNHPALDHVHIPHRDVDKSTGGKRTSTTTLALISRPRRAAGLDRSSRHLHRTRALRLMRAEGQDQAVQRVMERMTEPDVIDILEDSLTHAGIEQWLRASNRLLGGRRPLDLIREGDLDEVKEAAKAFVDGGYV